MSTDLPDKSMRVSGGPDFKAKDLHQLNKTISNGQGVYPSRAFDKDNGLVARSSSLVLVEPRYGSVLKPGTVENSPRNNENALKSFINDHSTKFKNNTLVASGRDMTGNG